MVIAALAGKTQVTIAKIESLFLSAALKKPLVDSHLSAREALKYILAVLDRYGSKTGLDIRNHIAI